MSALCGRFQIKKKVVAFYPEHLRITPVKDSNEEIVQLRDHLKSADTSATPRAISKVVSNYSVAEIAKKNPITAPIALGCKAASRPLITHILFGGPPQDQKGLPVNLKSSLPPESRVHKRARL